MTQIPSDMRDNIFILSGPSGSGKSTVYEELQKRIPRIKRAITVTTRELREHEVHGRDYYFVSELEFSRWKETGLFVESSFYDNAYYATPVSELERYSSDTPVFLSSIHWEKSPCCDGILNLLQSF